MSSAVYERIRSNPRFDQLVAARSRLSWTLSAIVLVVFYGLILVVAFNPALMGQRLGGETSMVTLGVVVILSMFIVFWLFTAVYVHRANTTFDDMTKAIVQEAERGARK